VALPTVRTSTLGRLAPYGALGLALVAWTAVTVEQVRTMWFTNDDFAFLLERTVSFRGPHGLLVPHNEHWSTIPILLFRMDFALFGMRHYLPYAVMAVACHVLISVLVFALLRVSRVRPWVAVLGALVAAYTAGGAGSENTLWAFQVGFLSSCVFGLTGLLLLASGRWGKSGRALAVLALVLSLMSSGIGLLMVVWAGAYLMFRDGFRAAVEIVLIPALVYCLWYLVYGRGHSGAPKHDLSVAPLAALKGLGDVWSQATAMPHAGPAILLAMIAVAFVPRSGEALFPLAASGLLTVVAAYGLFGYSRSGFGLDAAMASRYVYFGILFCVPALAAGLLLLADAIAVRPPQVSVLAWAVAAGVVVAVGSAQAAQSAVRERQVAPNRLHTVAAARLIQSGVPLLGTQPMPIRNPAVTVSMLDKPAVLAAVPRIDPGRRAELDVASSLQVASRNSTFGFAPATGYAWADGQDPTGATDAPSQRCRSRHLAQPADLDVPLAQTPAELQLTMDGQAFTTLLVSDGIVSDQMQWTTRPGRPVYVGSTARDATLRVVLPAGNVTVCGN